MEKEEKTTTMPIAVVSDVLVKQEGPKVPPHATINGRQHVCHPSLNSLRYYPSWSIFTFLRLR
jgi:hypothetical protein